MNILRQGGGADVILAGNFRWLWGITQPNNSLNSKLEFYKSSR